MSDMPEWSKFERIDHDNGYITYESHGLENSTNNTFIVVQGHKAKEISEEITKSIAYTRAKDERDDVIRELESALTSAHEYFENNMDADYQGEETGYVPNEEMRLAQEISEALSRAKALMGDNTPYEKAVDEFADNITKETQA